MSKKPILVIPIFNKEWDNLSPKTQHAVTKIEDRTNEFIRFLYRENPEVAEEILKRIGFAISSEL